MTLSPTKYYSYFFTRQDISPEQQIVQTAHAALKLGVNSHEITSKIDPDQTYFTLVGVRNIEALDAVIDILNTYKFKYEVFFEPDLGDTPTSVALYPIAEYNRGPLMAFNLLKIK